MSSSAVEPPVGSAGWWKVTNKEWPFSQPIPLASLSTRLANAIAPAPTETKLVKNTKLKQLLDQYQPQKIIPTITPPAMVASPTPSSPPVSTPVSSSPGETRVRLTCSSDQEIKTESSSESDDSPNVPRAAEGLTPESVSFVEFLNQQKTPVDFIN
jgi:hypothetical protein